jgi:hypothetical protein
MKTIAKKIVFVLTLIASSGAIAGSFVGTATNKEDGALANVVFALVRPRNFQIATRLNITSNRSPRLSRSRSRCTNLAIRPHPLFSIKRAR